MNLRLNAIVDDSIVDGPGIRMTVFTQGCPHGCVGCHNPQTHDSQKGIDKDVNEILKRVKENPLLDGITLSGGEPFLQSKACAQLAKAVRALGLSVWTYTGYTFEELLKEINTDSKQVNTDSKQVNIDFLDLLKNSDVLVDGRFLADLRSLNLLFRGSSNQRILLGEKSWLAKKSIPWEPPVY